MIYIILIAVACILWYLICEVFDTIKNLFKEKKNENGIILIGAIIGIIGYYLIF